MKAQVIYLTARKTYQRAVAKWDSNPDLSDRQNFATIIFSGLLVVNTRILTYSEIWLDGLRSARPEIP